MKIKSVEKIQELKFLKSYRIEFEDKEGNQKNWEIVSRGDKKRLLDEIQNGNIFSDGAMIFAISKDKSEVCMIKEFRVPAGRYVYSVPAGLSDMNESIESAAIREFKEETGMDLEVVKVDTPRYTSVGLSNETVNIVYGYYSGTPTNAYLESTEDISVEIVDKARAMEIIKNEVVTIRAYLLLVHFFRLNDFFD